MSQKLVNELPLKKVTSFLGVGVFNTIFNVFIFDIFIFLLNMGNLLANFLSLVISITISFFLNRAIVFKDERQIKSTQLINFMLGTFVIQLVTQHLAVLILGEKYTFAGDVLYSFSSTLGFGITREFFVLNVAKGLGVLFSILLSYFFYDKIIFESNQA